MLGYLDFFVIVVEFKLLYVCPLFIKNGNFGLGYVQSQTPITAVFFSNFNLFCISFCESEKIAKINELMFVSLNFGFSLFPLQIFFK